jgi:hypothetical protein
LPETRGELSRSTIDCSQSPDDRLLSEPDRGRASVGFFVQDGATKSVFGRLGFRGKLRLADGELISFDGLNRKRVPSEIVLFTPEFHRTTLTPSDGTEVVIQNGRITEIRSDSGSSLIPSSGMVLSIGGERVEEVLPRMQLGGRVSVEMTLVPLLPDPEGEWDKAEHIVSGGPLLLWRGNPLEEPQVESISRVFFLARHPRTAVGVRADGGLLFVTVDGRRPEESVGMSLPELTDLMLGLGSIVLREEKPGGMRMQFCCIRGSRKTAHPPGTRDACPTRVPDHICGAPMRRPVSS